eukprot:5716934-Alexandrium_andersonii.AAC.1
MMLLILGQELWQHVDFTGLPKFFDRKGQGLEGPAVRLLLRHSHLQEYGVSHACAQRVRGE